jgi:anhydro-N-acetylmuramic acid kinase
MHIIGLMSGSSLDGLDIAFAEIEGDTIDGIRWKLHTAETMPFSPVWQARLRDLERTDALTFARTNTYFGRYLAELVNSFLEKNQLAAHEIDLISSHGHTIFHDPHRQYTTQIGCGATLCALTNINVASDFRTQDIALNGEGTPIAPIADRFLFAGHHFYLNIGGIANISANINGKMIAFDTSPANQILNRLAQKLGHEYDFNGNLAKAATANTTLNAQLFALEYYKKNYPKSLSNQWCQQEFYQLFENFDDTPENKLATMTLHIAEAIADSVVKIKAAEAHFFANTVAEQTMFITGGGALNQFLIQQIQAAVLHLGVRVIVPDRAVIDFKEALLMCLVGYLRKQNIPNTIASVTGAKRDTIGGALFER